MSEISVNAIQPNSLFYPEDRAECWVHHRLLKLGSMQTYLLHYRDDWSVSLSSPHRGPGSWVRSWTV